MSAGGRETLEWFREYGEDRTFDTTHFINSSWPTPTDYQSYTVENIMDLLQYRYPVLRHHKKVIVAYYYPVLRTPKWQFWKTRQYKIGPLPLDLNKDNKHYRAALAVRIDSGPVFDMMMDYGYDVPEELLNQSALDLARDECDLAKINPAIEDCVNIASQIAYGITLEIIGFYHGISECVQDITPSTEHDWGLNEAVLYSLCNTFIYMNRSFSAGYYDLMPDELDNVD